MRERAKEPMMMCPHCGSVMEVTQWNEPNTGAVRTKWQCPGCNLSGPVLDTANIYDAAEATAKVFRSEKPLPFYMVKGQGPTSYEHRTFSDACSEALRLATENPGYAFDVLVSVRQYRKDGDVSTDYEIKRTLDELKDEFPF